MALIPVAPLTAAVLQTLEEDGEALNRLAVRLWGERSGCARGKGDVTRLRRILGLSLGSPASKGPDLGLGKQIRSANALQIARTAGIEPHRVGL